MKKMLARNQLRRAFRQLRQTVFPVDSVVDDRLSELHARLALYDGHVAGVAMSVLAGSHVEPSWLVGDGGLRRDLDDAVHRYEGDARRDAEAVLSRCQLLDAVLEAARRAAGCGGPRPT